MLGEVVQLIILQRKVSAASEVARGVKRRKVIQSEVARGKSNES